MSRRKNTRHLDTRVAVQTLRDLERLAIMAGYGSDLGRVVDKLVRDRMVQLRAQGVQKNGGSNDGRETELW